MSGSFGFHAGTLVHTPQGIAKIESLQPSDLVLSMSSDGSRVEPRRIINIVRQISQELHCVEIIPSSAYFEYEQTKLCIPDRKKVFVLAAARQQIMVVPRSDSLRKIIGPSFPVDIAEANGWMPVEEIYSQAGHCLRLIDGTDGVVTSRTIVHRTDTVGVGWVISEFARDLGLDEGQRIDLREDPPKFSVENDYNEGIDWWEDVNSIEATTIHLGIEGDGIFFIGEYGFVVCCNA